MKTSKFGGIIYVENATVQELEDFFKIHKYQRFRALDGDAYPAIFVRTLPRDFRRLNLRNTATNCLSGFLPRWL